MNVLVVDVGGSSVKILAAGQHRAGDNANAFLGGFIMWEEAPGPCMHGGHEKAASHERTDSGRNIDVT